LHFYAPKDGRNAHAKLASIRLVPATLEGSVARPMTYRRPTLRP
jgi:hypothetical protein